MITTTIPSKHLQSSFLSFLIGNSKKKLRFSFLLSRYVSLYSVWCVSVGLRVRRGIEFSLEYGYFKMFLFVHVFWDPASESILKTWRQAAVNVLLLVSVACRG